MKKLFALLAVSSLAVFVGCDDKKSTGKPSNQTTGGTFERTVTHREDVTNKVTNTVVEKHVTEAHVGTVATTVTVKETKPEKGPGLPAGDKKPGDK